jgi:hypothetical protein
MGAGRDPSHPDPKIQQAGIDYLTHCIDGTAQMGGTMVVGPLYAAVGRQWQATPEQRKADLELAAKNLRVAADHAEQKGIKLAIEPLNRFETSFINLTEQALELVELIGSPVVGLMMDTFHANIEEKHLGKAIEMAGPKLWHMHANENDRGTGHVDREGWQGAEENGEWRRWSSSPSRLRSRRSRCRCLAGATLTRRLPLKGLLKKLMQWVDGTRQSPGFRFSAGYTRLSSQSMKAQAFIHYRCDPFCIRFLHRLGLTQVERKHRRAAIQRRDRHPDRYDHRGRGGDVPAREH